jgi:transcriptional regulator with XRE-family HTH domain
MDARLVANYLTSLREKNGLSFEAWAEKSGRSVSTIKNLCSGKTEDPRLDTVAPVTYAGGGSLDELYTGKSKDKIKEFSIESIKEMYEFQLAEYKATEEAHINNIRAHYEQHRQDFKESYDRQLEFKNQLYNEKCKENRLFKILAGVGYGILIGLLILEVANPSLGWLRF